MKNIVLIGMPGVGKSTIGVILAKEIGYHFLDSDLVIQDQEQRLLKEIIAQEGVDGFIDIENRINAQIAAKRSVIATGGSVVYGKEAMEHFKETGLVVYLKCSYKRLSKRLGDLKGRGVVLKKGQTLKDIYEERCILYEKYADIVVEEGNKGIEETLAELLSKLGGRINTSGFYYTRHGQTIWNVENKICGATDIALTPKGFEQARELGIYIREQELAIDEIICSPLMRAYDTAKCISEETGIPVRKEPRLIEQNFGKYESTPRDGKEFEKAKMNFISRFDGGESMLEVGQRIYDLIDDLKAESSQKTYLLVAHNGIARFIESYFRDMDNEEFAKYGMKNCELKWYDFDKRE